MRHLTQLAALVVTLSGPAQAQHPVGARTPRVRATPQMRKQPGGDHQLVGAGAIAFRGSRPLDGGEWAAVHDLAAGGADLGYSAAIDALGDVYVGGESESPAGDWDACVLKFDRYGQLLWERAYGGAGGGRDYVTTIAVDGDGAVLVAAVTKGLGTSNDMSVLKYDTNGTLLWSRSYNGPANGSDLFGGTSLALDAAGTAYVCGTSWGGASSYDSLVLAYATDGSLLWEDRHDGPASAFDDSYAIAADGAGSVYVGADVTDLTTDFQVRKYSTGGALLWQTTYDGPGAGNDYLYDLALVGDQGVAVTGTSEGAGTSSDFATARFDAAGNLMWDQAFDGAAPCPTPSPQTPPGAWRSAARRRLASPARRPFGSTDLPERRFGPAPTSPPPAGTAPTTQPTSCSTRRATCTRSDGRPAARRPGMMASS